MESQTKPPSAEAKAPIWEVITQKIQAIHNSTLTNPPITQKSLNRMMQAWEEKLSGKLAMMVSTINLNMDKCVEAAIDILKVQTASIATTMGAV